MIAARHRPGILSIAMTKSQPSQPARPLPPITMIEDGESDAFQPALDIPDWVQANIIS